MELSYESQKAIFKNFSRKKRLELVKKGGLFETLDKLSPRPISSLEINNYDYKIDGKIIYIYRGVAKINYYYEKREDDEEGYSRKEQVVFRGRSDWDCVKHILNLNAKQRLVVVDTLKIGYASIFVPENAEQFTIHVKKHLSFWPNEDFTTVLPFLSFPERLEKLSINVGRENDFQLLQLPVAKNCKKLVFCGSINSPTELLNALVDSKHQHVHIPDGWNYRTANTFLELINLWIRTFRPIGTALTIVLHKFDYFLDATEALLAQQPTAFRSRDPEMDIMEIYSKGVTVPLDKDRELMINSELNRHIPSRARDWEMYIFKMRILKKGHTVAQPKWN